MEAYGLKGDDYLTESLTYTVAMIDDLQNQLNNNTISREDLTFLNFKKKTLVEYQKDRNWTCGKVCLNKCNKTFNSKYELLQHEVGCYNIEKIGSSIQYKFAECNICGKKFYDKGQKLKPKYALSHHLKSCRKLLIKKQRKEIKSMLETATDLQIQNIFKYLNNNEILPQEEIFTRLPLPSRSPSPITMTISPQPILDEEDLERPKSNVSVETNSSLEDWEYQDEHYWIDNKNRVYDREEIYLGKRFMNDWENWEIEFEEDIIKY